MLLNNVLVFLFFSVTFRSDFCLQHPQFSSGSLSVSAVDSRAAVQILQSERCLFSNHSHSLTDRPLLSVFLSVIAHYLQQMVVVHKKYLQGKRNRKH